MQTIARKRVQRLRQSFPRSVRLIMLSGRGEKRPQIARNVDARVQYRDVIITFLRERDSTHRFYSAKLPGVS